MKRVDLRVQSRTRTGKGAARALRREGFIPGVVYGRQLNRPVKVSPRSLETIFKTTGGTNALLNLTIEEDGKEEKTLAITKELQVDPLKGFFLHVDFLAITADQPITVTVPVALTGEAKGVSEEQGVLNFQLQEVEVSCLPDNIPDELVAGISGLGIGEAFFVRDLPSPDGVQILTAADEPIASVSAPAVVVEEEAEEEVAEGEVEEKVEAPAAEAGEAGQTET